MVKTCANWAFIVKPAVISSEFDAMVSSPTQMVIVVKSDAIAGKRLSELHLSEYGCFLNRVIRAQIEMPMDLDIVLAKGDILQVSGEKSRVHGLAERIGFISIHSQIADLLAFCSFFILGIMFGLVTMTFGQVSFSLGNAVGLLLSGITLGFLRANHPTFGYVPQGALNMVKDLGLMIFMVGIGLSAGGKMAEHLWCHHRREDMRTRNGHC